MKEQLEYLDRRGSDCIKWDAMEEKFDDAGLIPLWIADMDFRSPKCVREAMTQWAQNGLYAYYKIPDAFYEAFIRWEGERHGYAIQRDWLRFSPGIVTAAYWLTQIFSRPGDGIMLLTPVYYPFFSAIEDTGRRLVGSDLINTDGVYTIDFEDFESKIVAEKASLFILCTPHNPVGRVWERWELERLAEICARHNVTIISDEIHHDLVCSGKKHIPTATLGIGRVVTTTSASKTFNMAGLQNSFIILPDPEMRAAFDHYIQGVNVKSGNMAGYIATRAAYEGGAGWLESLLDQVRENYERVRQAAKLIPGAVLSPMEGT